MKDRATHAARGSEILGERWTWLVVADGEFDLCREDLGHELTLVVEASVASLTGIRTGDSNPDAEQQARLLLVRGSRPDSRAAADTPDEV